jgi:hypothetical protein
MRVAALYDIHANLPALDAVLGEVERAGVDRIVVGGDVVPGPLPVETIERLRVDDPNPKGGRVLAGPGGRANRRVLLRTGDSTRSRAAMPR